MIMLTVALLLGMVLCLLFGVPYIEFLKKRTIGQYILDVAPESHAKKAGTPTTGGVFSAKFACPLFSREQGR